MLSKDNQDNIVFLGGNWFEWIEKDLEMLDYVFCNLMQVFLKLQKLMFEVVVKVLEGDFVLLQVDLFYLVFEFGEVWIQIIL